jgi:hypothetical protein
MVRGPFSSLWETGWKQNNYSLLLKGGLNIGLTLFMMAAVAIIFLQALTRWLNHARGTTTLATRA